MRPRADAIILLIHENSPVDEIIMQVHSLTDDMTPRHLDGLLNYLFTQILRTKPKRDYTYSAMMIDLILNELFWLSPNYLGYERVTGLLFSMIHEYNRRKWRNRKEVTRILKRLLRRNLCYMDMYEDKKIALNGDLQ